MPEHAVILAAGVGARLKWLTDERPKALMRIGDAPAIAGVIRRLAAAGIREVAVNAHHHSSQLADYLGDGSRFGVSVRISHEEELLDSGGGVRTALDLMRIPEHGRIVVHNADVLADIDLRTLAAACPDAGGAIALVPNPAHNARGDFELAGSSVGLCGPDASGASYTYAGVAVFDVAVFAGYEAGQLFSLVELLHALIGEERLAGVAHRGEWFDIGRPRDLMLARKMMIGRGEW